MTSTLHFTKKEEQKQKSILNLVRIGSSNVLIVNQGVTPNGMATMIQEISFANKCHIPIYYFTGTSITGTATYPIFRKTTERTMKKVKRFLKDNSPR